MIQTLWSAIKRFDSLTVTHSLSIENHPLSMTFTVQSSEDEEEMVYVPQRQSSRASDCDEPPPLEQTVDHKVFQSLFEMMRGVQSSNSFTIGWLQFVKECAESGKCTVADLCQKYKGCFRPDKDGQLHSIHIPDQKLTGTLKLSKIPHSVKHLNLFQNELSDIGEWKDLEGKALEYLNVDRNPLVLNLKDLSRCNRDILSLRVLVVKRTQIAEYLQISESLRWSPIVSEWVMQSSLDQIIVIASNRPKHIGLFRNGTIARTHTIKALLQ